MPLIGLVDPSHKTRKEDGVLGSLPPWFTPDELLEHGRVLRHGHGTT